jgi:anti-sigma factor RsiW
MTSNFDAGKHANQEAVTEMDSLQRDRFELLSAYIDGEVTAAERKQVQEWLATDSQMQCLYSRLTKLRQGIVQIPVPTPAATAQETAEQVFTRIDKRRNRRTVIWGGAAIAALFVSAVSGIIPGSRSLVPQLAQKPDVSEPPLEIALNQPVIEIPKGAVAESEKGVQPSFLPRSLHDPRLN